MAKRRTPSRPPLEPKDSGLCAFRLAVEAALRPPEEREAARAFRPFEYEHAAAVAAAVEKLAAPRDGGLRLLPDAASLPPLP